MKNRLLRPYFLAVFVLSFQLISCTKESDMVIDILNQELTEDNNVNCSQAILYNTSDIIGLQTSPYKIAIKVGEKPEQILVEDDKYDFWWARLHPSKAYFICYRSPIGDNKADNDYARAELWKFNIDGSNGEKLIALSDYGWKAQGVADWSPDGKYLVIAAEIADDPTKPADSYFQLVRTDADGKNPVQLTKGSGLRADPSWSVDGKKIIYSAFPQDYKSTNVIADILFQNKLEIHIADIDEAGILSNITQLTNDDIRDNDPYMAPDGSYIAWESFEDNGGTLRTYNMESKEVDTVLDNGELLCCPTWLEDPNRLLIHSIKFGVTAFYIAEVNLDDNTFTPVLKANNKHYINPQWICLPE